uniref:SasC/FmtB family protein n=1 Tax=Streptococcus sp. k-378 TaxID=2582632 RepID=UPI0015620A05
MFHKGKHDREKQLRFSIRKVSFGAASVAVAALFMFLGNGAVSAAEQSVPSTNGETQAPQPKEPNAQNGTYEGNTVATSPAATVETNTQPSTVENSPSPESAPQKVETLDKKELTDLIKEIDGKFAKGTYATKTEESVNNLRAVLEEARTDLSTATTKTELTAAYRKLITATSKLQTKSEKKKEQAVDNTSDKGSKSPKNASAEKPLESNSIANSGSRDERNGKALDTNNPFRTGTDAAPSTSASTDPLAANEHGVSIINGNFSDTTLGAELPTATSPIASTIVELSKLKGWNAVDSSTNKVLLIWAAKTGNYESALPGPKTNIAAVLSAYNERGNGGTPNTEYGPIYQDIDVVPGQEVIVSYRSQSIGQTTGINGAKLIVKDANTGTKIAEDRANYQGYPLGEFSKIVNVPDGVTKLRLQFESINNRSHDEANTHRTPDGIYAGASVSNVRVGSGAYVVPTVTETSFSKTAVSATAQKVTVRIQARLENKGEATSTSPVYSLAIPEGARLASYDRSKIVPTTTGNQLSMRVNSVRPKSSQEFWYELELPATKAETFVLNPTVTYQTNGNLISGTTVATTKKEGVITSPAQTVTVNMYKADLRAEEAKAATLNQSDYTPEAWAAYQAEVAKAQAILNEETNNVEIANRKNQADINAQTLLLQKAKAKLDLEKAAKAEKAAIAADNSLTAAQRTAKEKEVDTKKTEEESKITAADTADAVEAAKTAGVTAIEGVHTPGNLDTVKEKALEAIQTASETKIASIDKNAKLSDDEKAAAKAEVAQATIAAVNAINEAKDQAGVDGAQTTGTTAVEAVNPVGKEKALEAIQTASETKIASIDKNAKLSDAEKAAAKAEVAQAAIAAVNAINEAKDQDGVDSAQTTGTTAINAVNPVGKEKALEAIQTASETKIASIDKNAKLSDAEKAAAKAEVAQAAIAAVNAINEAKDQAGVDGAQTTG